MTFNNANREILRITAKGRLIVGEGLSTEETTQEAAKMLITAFGEQINKMVDARVAAMKVRAEKAEAESNKLLEHGIQVLMIARSWAMVWGDKLSPDSVDLFTKHEQAFLSVKEASK
jgi:histidinol dehydrogenase